MTRDLVPGPNVQLIASSGVPGLLERIRPHWRAKSLIERVERLVHVDPSSACQRLFNAAMHDLREKVIVAGLDIASEAASQHRLPPVAKEEDVENYSTARLIDLCYRMGLLTRPEWRRVSRSYEIRRDLEHEDDEYEAGVEDCVYIFSTCIDVILSVDPITLIKVTDIKQLVEQGSAVIPGAELLDDFNRAPQPRQIEILKFLTSVALDAKQSDIVQQNAYVFLTYFRPFAQNQSLLSIAQNFSERIGRNGLDERHARVASACGAMPYLKQSARRELFTSYLARLTQIGTHWSAHSQHGDILRGFEDLGGFGACPEPPLSDIVKWMTLTFLGEPGGRTSYGNVRHVFYSNSAAPLIRDIVHRNPSAVRPALIALSNDKAVRSRIADQHIARRYETLLDLVEPTNDAP